MTRIRRRRAGGVATIPIAEMVNKHEESITALQAAIFGDRETVGINEQLRTIKSMINTLVKLAWIIVGAVVAVVISGTTTAVVYLIKEIR